MLPFSSARAMDRAAKKIQDDQQLFHKVKEILFDKEGRAQAEDMLRKLHVKPGVSLETVKEKIENVSGGTGAAIQMAMAYAAFSPLMGETIRAVRGDPAGGLQAAAITAAVAVIGAIAVQLGRAKAGEKGIEPMRGPLRRPWDGAPIHES